MQNTTILVTNDGMGRAVAGSPVLAQLAALEERGVRLLICSTCLNDFGLTDKVKAGTVGGMGDILEAQTRTEKAITL